MAIQTCSCTVIEINPFYTRHMASKYPHQWRIQMVVLVARKPPLAMIFLNQGFSPLLAQTFTSHLNLRLLETPPETNSGYATAHVIRTFGGKSMLQKINPPTVFPILFHRILHCLHAIVIHQMKDKECRISNI